MRTPVALGVAVVTVVLAAVTVALVVRSGGDDGVPVRLEQAAATTPNPFTASVATTGATETATLERFRSDASPAPSPAGIGALDGATPGLYGSTPGGAVCDPAALAAALAADPGLAAAWAEAADVATDVVDDTIASLAPVVLGRDTAVTNHSYRSGRVRAYQAVLQAGTPVLVDALGVPRVRCACGNPLGPPSVTGLSGARLEGSPWDRFQLDDVVRVAPAPAPMAGLSTVDVASGSASTVPVGPTTTTTTTTAASPVALVVDHDGVGPLRVGMGVDQATVTGLIGPQDPGCELGGPGATDAPLLPPMSGWARFQDGVLQEVSVDGGAATPEGLTPGTGLDAAETQLDAVGRAWRLDRSFDEMFGIWVLTVGDENDGYDLVIDPGSRTVSSVEAPATTFCE